MSFKRRKLDKSNYRPVSIVPVISKIYERLMYAHILIKSLNFNAAFVNDLALKTAAYI